MDRCVHVVLAMVRDAAKMLHRALAFMKMLLLRDLFAAMQRDSLERALTGFAHVYVLSLCEEFVLMNW
jgi:hypothetical protein